MASRHLKTRNPQPGNDQSFRDSERNFEQAARAFLDEERYDLESDPRDLATIFHRDPSDQRRSSGIRPDFLIRSRETGLPLYIEVKKQESRVGNAGYERACRNYTEKFQEVLRDFLKEYQGLKLTYHPIVTIFCEALATEEIYGRKIEALIESDHYLLWANYDQELLCNYLRDRCEAWLD